MPNESSALPNTSATEPKRLKNTGPKRLNEFGATSWQYAPDFGRGIAPPPMSWNFDPPTDEADRPDWEDLLHQGKCFIDTLAKWNLSGKPLKVRTLLGIHARLRYLLAWMARQRIWSFSGLDQDAAGDFLEDLARDKVTADEFVTKETLADYLNVLCRIHEQRSWLRLRPGPHAVMDKHPYAGRTAYEVAGTVAEKGEGWIPPVPDDVWLPTVKAAIDWLDANAGDVVRLGGILEGLVIGEKRPGSMSFDDEFGSAISGAGHDGKLSAWLDEMRRLRRSPMSRRRQVGRGRREASVLALYRSLLNDLRDAAAIVIQSMVGMRISELAALASGPARNADEWPDCLEIHPSRNGRDEIFHVRGHVFKLRDVAEEVTWVAGSRTAGTDHVPAAVKALLAVHKAFAPWRSRSDATDLFVTFTHGSVIPMPGSPVRSMPTGLLVKGQRRFMLTHAELPEGRKDWPLSSHQWRKSFAINVIRADGRLLAPLGDHFKHLSIVMTERGYLGRDPTLLGMVDDVGVREAAKLLFEAATGNSAIAGRMAEVVSRNAERIVRMGGGGDVERRVERVEAILKHDDVRAWPTDWGYCLFRPETSRCHHSRAEDRPIPRKPDHLHRHPGVCCECANLVVTKRHVEFWRERARENRAAAEVLARDGETLAAMAATERADISQGHFDRFRVATEALQREATA